MSTIPANTEIMSNTPSSVDNLILPMYCTYIFVYPANNLPGTAEVEPSQTSNWSVKRSIFREAQLSKPGSKSLELIFGARSDKNIRTYWNVKF